MDALQRPPNDFPDALPRRKRTFSPLPLAPPLPPRSPTEAELAREIEMDINARNMLVISFTSLVQEFLKKYRKVVASVKVSISYHVTISRSSLHVLGRREGGITMVRGAGCRGTGERGSVRRECNGQRIIVAFRGNTGDTIPDLSGRTPRSQRGRPQLISSPNQFRESF